MVLMTKNIAKQSYLNSDIPRVILDRLPIYLRILSQLQQEEIKITSSNKISQSSNALSCNPSAKLAAIRFNLALTCNGSCLSNTSSK